MPSQPQRVSASSLAFVEVQQAELLVLAGTPTSKLAGCHDLFLCQMYLQV